MSTYGKYRGTVTANADPLRLGRVQVLAPDVSPDPLGWALPCTPYAGPGVGLYAVPPVGASIWVEFERGDPGLPIWSGCFWNEGELPAAATDPGVTVLQVGNASIVFGSNRVSIEDGLGASVVLSGPGVSINGGALEVV
jgi:uncharacterized protein involved in type VI secretion and phage assembly